MFKKPALSMCVARTQQIIHPKFIIPNKKEYL
jgi:hypothetical protein